MTTDRESNFESDWHCLYCGWVIGKAILYGIPVTPVVDEDGNYLPELMLTLTNQQTYETAVVTLVIPPPPDEWQLA